MRSKCLPIYVLVFVIAVLSVPRDSLACPVTTTLRVGLPQIFDLCETGTWSPAPTGIERLLFPPPPNAFIVKTRLHATFVTTDLCNPTFDAGNLGFILSRADGVEWIVAAVDHLGWSGSGSFSTTIETDLFNGGNPGGFWHDTFFALVETQVDGHFHTDVLAPDAYWEIEYVDADAIDGDVTCDGRINFADMTAFATALVDPDTFVIENEGCNILRADMDCDQLVNANDIPLFIELLLNAPLNGRCCFTDGTCEEMLAEDCQAFSGLFGGNFSICEDGTCPPSNPQITSTFFSPPSANNCDGDDTNLGMLNVSGEGFHPEIFAEFTQAGQPNVAVFGVNRENSQTLNIEGIPLGCFPSAGAWDLLLTNPDGETATFANAMTLAECNDPAWDIDNIVFTPIEVLTCPSTDETNQDNELLVDIFGSSLPSDLATGSFDSRVQVNFVDANTEEVWISAVVSQVELVQPGHYRVQFLISNGNVNFPTSYPPAGTYKVTITGCTQSVEGGQTVVIRPECPP